METWIYELNSDIRPSPKILGGKGAGLLRMQQMGMPIPDGFIISTSTGLTYLEHERTIPEEFLYQLSNAYKKLVERSNSLETILFAARSGAPFSMPGQMPTILNLGISRSNIDKFPSRLKPYFQFLQLTTSFALAVGVLASEVDYIKLNYDKANTTTLLQMIEQIEILTLEKAGFILPESPFEQLLLAIQSIWNSWESNQVRNFRTNFGHYEQTCTAVIIQKMVLGNLNKKSGSGVIFSRDIANGKKISGSFVVEEQGSAIVGGEQAGQSIDVMKLSFPQITKTLINYVGLLEKETQKPVEVEFTIENGTLWLLQVRIARLSDIATIKWLVDSVKEGLFSDELAVELATPALIDRLTKPVLSKNKRQQAIQEGKLLALGVPASAYVGTGTAISSYSSAQIMIEKSLDFIWVCETLDARDYNIIKHAKGVISVRGGIGSHGAVIVNLLSKPCIVNCSAIKLQDDSLPVNGVLIAEMTLLTIDGINGEIFEGYLEADEPLDFPELNEFKVWWQEYDGTKGNLTINDGQPHSPWRNAIADINIKYVEELKNNIRALLKQKSWIHEKANVIEALYIFPEDIRIKQFVLHTYEIDRLKALMTTCIESGYWCGIRTVTVPGEEGKSFIQVGIKNSEEINIFIESYRQKMQSQIGQYIIVVFDPPEKTLYFEREHFVCNLICQSDPSQLIIELHPQAVFLRAFETAHADEIIRITIEVDPANSNILGKRNLFIGKKYWKPENLPQILDDQSGSSMENIEDKITRMLYESNWDEKKLEKLVGIRISSIIKHVWQKLLVDWWGEPHMLPFKMRALDEVYSLHILELQGRATLKGEIKWFLIFDAKGKEEKRTAYS